MIILTGELGKITLDVGSRVQEYMRTLPLPLNIYEKLPNWVYLRYMLHTLEENLNNGYHDPYFCFLNFRGT